MSDEGTLGPTVPLALYKEALRDRDAARAEVLAVSAMYEGVRGDDLDQLKKWLSQAERERDEARAALAEARAVLRDVEVALWHEKMAHDLAGHATDGSRESLIDRVHVAVLAQEA